MSTDVGTASARAAAFIAIVLYVPFCMNFIWKAVPIDVVFWNALLSALMLAVALSRQRMIEDRAVRWLVMFCVVFLFVGALNLMRDGGGSLSFLARHSGVFLALSLAYYFATLRLTDRHLVFRRLVPIVGIAFVLQLLFSLYESLFIGDYVVQSFDWNTSQSSFDFDAPVLQDRLQIGLIFSGLQLPFSTPFTGMLGQHNHWGTQLPFYNLLFGYYFFAAPEHRRWVAPLLILVFVASILNTSRFGILSILVVDVALFIAASKVRRWIKILVVAVPLAYVLMNLDAVVELSTTYISLTDTFGGRLDTWSEAGPQVLTRGVFDVVFGSPNSTIYQIQRQLDWPDFENLALSLLMEKGGLVLALFLGLLVTLWKSVAGRSPLDTIALRLLVICMVLVSLWSNVLLRASSIGIATVIICGLAQGVVFPGQKGAE